MRDFTFSPALGWPVALVVVVAMAGLAVACVVVWTRTRANTDMTALACVRRVLIALLLAALALTPSVTQATMSRAVNDTNVVIAVDVTGSMAVRDAHYGSANAVSRLQAARAAAHDITGLYPDASFSALSFGASSTVDVPLTPDSDAIRNWADTLRTEPTTVSRGSSLDAPLDRLLLQLKSMREQRGGDSVILYLITDGEQTDTRARRSYSALRGYLDDAFTVGVGSTQGGRIPLTAAGVSATQQDTEGQERWVEDPTTGKPGVSKMDEKNLKAIADELGGTYLPIDARHTAAAGASERASRRYTLTSAPKPGTRTTPVVWPLAIALTMLTLWELAAWMLSGRRLLR